MLRRSSLLLAIVFALWFPGRLLAGGPPWLCLPIDGVTPKNAPALEQLLSTKLGDGLSKYVRRQGVQALQHQQQWYAAFYMGRPVALSEVEQALRGSEFSVPRERLRLFGHVVLQMDADASSRDRLLKSLNALDQVTVAEPSQTKDLLLEVTVDMPYPVADSRRDLEDVSWDTFRRNDLSTGSDRTPVTAEKLPRLAAFSTTLKEHEATLKDVVWSDTYACRPLGAVVSKKATKVSER